MSNFQTQIGGDHYSHFAIQPTEFIQRNNLNWCEGNIIKYIARHRRKNGIEDLRKAEHYLKLLMEMEYDTQRTNEDITEMGRADIRR